MVRTLTNIPTSNQSSISKSVRNSYFKHKGKSLLGIILSERSFQ